MYIVQIYRQPEGISLFPSGKESSFLISYHRLNCTAASCLLMRVPVFLITGPRHDPGVCMVQAECKVQATGRIKATWIVRLHTWSRLHAWFRKHACPKLHAWSRLHARLDYPHGPGYFMVQSTSLSRLMYMHCPWSRLHALSSRVEWFLKTKKSPASLAR